MQTYSYSSWTIVCAEQKVLMAMRSPKITNPGLWNFFGGKQEPDETPYHCALRELYEESGLTLDSGYALGQPFFLGSIRIPRVEFNYFGLAFSRKVVPTLNFESQEFAWFSPDDLPIAATKPTLLTYPEYLPEKALALAARLAKK